MPVPELTENDVAILDHLRASWKNEMAETLAPIRTELAAAKSRLAACGQKLSRPPGTHRHRNRIAIRAREAL